MSLQPSSLFVAGTSTFSSSSSASSSTSSFFSNLASKSVSSKPISLPSTLTSCNNALTLSPPQLAPYLFSLSSIPPPACLSNAVASLDDEKPIEESLNSSGRTSLSKSSMICSTGEIRLNVGGLLYMTSLQTLLNPSYGHTYFTAMFHGPWRESQIIRNVVPQNSTSMKQVFIDRDGQLFGYILNFLRDGFFPFLHYLSPSSLPFLSLLLHEAVFYQIDSLQKILHQSIEKLEEEKEKQREKEKENEWRMEFILQQKENERRKVAEHDVYARQVQPRRTRLSGHRHSIGSNIDMNSHAGASAASSSSSSLSSAGLCGKKCACQRCQPALYSFNYGGTASASESTSSHMDSDGSFYTEQESQRRIHSISPLVPKQSNFIFTTNEAF